MSDGERASPSIVERAPAKINLALHVTGRRADGYHTLDSLVVFADLGERLLAADADGLSLVVGGPFGHHAPDDERNLVLRAARALAREAGISPRAAVVLEKHIPAGAGLGGGSADAAAALRALDRLWRTSASREDLERIGLQVGADVPMCIRSEALRAGGIGERLTPAPATPPLSLALVWPGVPVATGPVFAQLETRENPPLPPLPAAFAAIEALVAWLGHTRNDLEAPALATEPRIGRALDRLRAESDCLVARMTGSGSAVFGIFPDDAAAERAARRLTETGMFTGAARTEPARQDVALHGSAAVEFSTRARTT